MGRQGRALRPRNYPRSGSFAHQKSLLMINSLVISIAIITVLMPIVVVMAIKIQASLPTATIPPTPIPTRILTATARPNRVQHRRLVQRQPLLQSVRSRSLSPSNWPLCKRRGVIFYMAIPDCQRLPLRLMTAPIRPIRLRCWLFCDSIRSKQHFSV